MEPKQQYTDQNTLIIEALGFLASASKVPEVPSETTQQASENTVQGFENPPKESVANNVEMAPSVLDTPVVKGQRQIPDDTTLQEELGLKDRYQKIDTQTMSNTLNKDVSATMPTDLYTPFDSVASLNGLSISNKALSKSFVAMDKKEEATHLKNIFSTEQGYQNDPGDSGNYLNGKNLGTNHGITPQTLAEFRRIPTKAITEKTMRMLSKKEATAIYKEMYIHRPHFDKLPKEVRGMVIDAAVNSGVPSTIKLLQRMIHVKQDGILGEDSLRKLQTLTADAFYPVKKEDYKKIAQGEKRQYLESWLTRLDKQYNLAKSSKGNK